MSVAEIWRRRVLLFLLTVCSAIPQALYRAVDTPLRDSPHVGGLHPMEIVMLRQFGQATIYLPLLFALALVISVFRPVATSTVLVICTATFIFSLLLLLFLAFFVIQSHI
jgi:hypothetical protein